MSRDMRKRLVQKCKEIIQFGEFTLASGKTSNYFLDLSKILFDSEGSNLARYLISVEMSKYIYDSFGGPATGANALIGSLLYARNKRGFVVTKDGKVEGCIRNYDHIIMLDDVLTTGGSIKRAYDVVRKEHKVELAAVGCIVDRNDGARELFEDYPFFSLVNIDEVLNA